MTDLVGGVGEAVEQVGQGETDDKAVGGHTQVGVSQDGQKHQRVAAYDHCRDDSQHRVVETATDTKQDHERYDAQYQVVEIVPDTNTYDGRFSI